MSSWVLEGFREEGMCRLNLWGEVSWSRWAAFGAVGEAEHRAGGARSRARSAPRGGKPQRSHRGLLRKEETGESASPSSPLERETGFQDPPPPAYSAPQNRLLLPRGLWWEPSLLGHVKLGMVGKHPFQVGMPLSEPVSEDQL